MSIYLIRIRNNSNSFTRLLEPRKELDHHPPKQRQIEPSACDGGMARPEEADGNRSKGSFLFVRSLCHPPQQQAEAL